MRAKTIFCFNLVAIFTISVGNILAGENLFTKSVHWPSDGDKVLKKHYEYIERDNDTLSIWDFGGAAETGKSHIMQWINIGDTILVKKEEGTQLTYNVRGGQRIFPAHTSARHCTTRAKSEVPRHAGAAMSVPLSGCQMTTRLHPPGLDMLICSVTTDLTGWCRLTIQVLPCQGRTPTLGLRSLTRGTTAAPTVMTLTATSHRCGATA